MLRRIFYFLFLNIFAFRNTENAEIEIETDRYWMKYRTKMAAFNAFDFLYDRIQNSETYKVQLGTLGGIDYSYFCYEYFKDENLWKVFPIEINELRMHRRYIFSSVLVEPTNEQVFVNMYTAYLSFWATIQFRIYSLTYSDSIYDETARDWEELSRLMHWFTFLLFERKVFDFSRIGDLDDGVKEGSGLDNSNVLNGIKDIVTGSTAKTIAEKLKNLNLDDIMDSSYIQKHRKTEPESEENRSLVFKNKQKEFKIMDRDEINDESRPLVMELHIPQTNSQSRLSLYYCTYPLCEEWHYYIWNKVIETLPPEIIDIENYFEAVLTGGYKTRIKKLGELIPPFRFSHQLWNTGRSTLMNIINQESWTPREIFYLRKTPIMFRSNPIEIIRSIEEMKFLYDIFDVRSVTEDDSEIEEIQKNAKIFKGESYFILKKSGIFGPEYVADYVYQRTPQKVR